jgi:hypothetical protein
MRSPLFPLALTTVLASLAAKSVYAPQERFEPGPASVELARQREIPLEGIAVDGSRSHPAAGDRCVVLVSLRTGKKVEQWLLDFTAWKFNAERQAQLAENPPPSFTLHASHGSAYEMTRDPMPVQVWIAGPLRLDEKRIERAVSRVKERRTRFVVNREYLGLGLAGGAETILRLRDEHGALGLSVGGTAFPEDEVRSTQMRLAERGVTEEDVARLVHSAPAMTEFFSISANTPGLRDLLFEVVDLPWMSMMSNLGIDSINIGTDGTNLRPVEGSPGCYVLPSRVELNGELAMMLEMVIEQPAAPASLLAGVTELYAGRPDGKKSRLSLQLLAAMTGATPEE